MPTQISTFVIRFVQIVYRFQTPLSPVVCKIAFFGGNSFEITNVWFRIEFYIFYISSVTTII